MTLINIAMTGKSRKINMDDKVITKFDVPPDDLHQILLMGQTDHSWLKSNNIFIQTEMREAISPPLAYFNISIFTHSPLEDTGLLLENAASNGSTGLLDAGS